MVTCCVNSLPRATCAFWSGATVRTLPGCAGNDGRNSNERAIAGRPLRIQQTIDFISNFIFPIRRLDPFVLGGDPAVAVDQKSGWQTVDAAVRIPYLVVPEQDAVVDLLLRNVFLDRVPAALIHGYTQNRESAVFELLL